MKRIAIVLFGIALTLGYLPAQSNDLRGTAEVTIDGKKISVEYGRPSLAGRDMLGRLVPGRAWRMGMNAATSLTTEATLNFGDGQMIAPGKYRLQARKDAEDSWEMIVSSTNGGGEVAVIPLHKHEAEEKVETFTIELSHSQGNQGEFSMMWDTLSVSADFTVE